MRQALVYRKNVLAGTLTEGEGEYSFVYDVDYLAKNDSRAISLTMPLQKEVFVSRTLHPTEYKYRSSYEQIGKTIAQFSFTPKLCMANFLHLLLFCYITGNNDMHLKNFSLYAPTGEYKLSPAYDLLNVAMANPRDKEELALTLNGKKSNINKADFMAIASKLGIAEKTICQMISTFWKIQPKWEAIIHESFLDDETKAHYLDIIRLRMEHL